MFSHPSAASAAAGKASASAKKKPRQTDEIDAVKNNDLPTAPKRKKRKARKLPRGAFGCFLARKPKELTQICEELPSRKGMALAGVWWRNQMSTSDREHYKKIYEELKGQYEEAKFQKQLAKARRKAMVKDEDEDLIDEENAQNFKLAPIAQVQALLSCGTDVLLEGVRGETELNGQRAKVEGFDVSLGRYVVKLDHSSELKRVRPDNARIFFKPGADVAIKYPPDLVGRHANAIDYDISLRKYFVRMFDTGEQKEILPEHLSLWFPCETDVILHGLECDRELNGQFAKVEGVEEQTGRYRVTVRSGSDEECKYVRPEDVLFRLPDGSDAIFEGAQVHVVGFDQNTRQYVLRSPQASAEDQPKQPKKVRPNRAWVAARVDVVVKSLLNVPELNGQRARVEGYDEVEETYLVRFASRRAVKENDLTSTRRDLERVQPRHLCRWFAPGSEVMIQGLSRELDGERGCVDRFLLPCSTYLVRMSKNSELKEVQPENLCLWYDRGMEVLVHGLPRNPDLNLQLAKVLGFDKKEGRYLVQMTKKVQNKLLQPDYIQARLVPGSRVVIDGLSLAPTLNGQIAKVVCFDDSRGRYTVRLANSSEVKRVRPENLFERDDESDDGEKYEAKVTALSLLQFGQVCAFPPRPHIL